MCVLRLEVGCVEHQLSSRVDSQTVQVVVYAASQLVGQVLLTSSCVVVVIAAFTHNAVLARLAWQNNAYVLGYVVLSSPLCLLITRYIFDTTKSVLTQETLNYAPFSSALRRCYWSMFFARCLQRRDTGASYKSGVKKRVSVAVVQYW